MKLSEMRKSIGLTQDQLARRIGVTSSAVNQYENRKRKPDILMTAKIAEALQVDIAEVVACFTEEKAE